MSQQEVSAYIIPHSALKILGLYILTVQYARLLSVSPMLVAIIPPLHTMSKYTNVIILEQSMETPHRRIQSGRKIQLGPDKQRGKPGLVWRSRTKISQIINDYLYFPFFLLIILWWLEKGRNCEKQRVGLVLP